MRLTISRIFSCLCLFFCHQSFAYMSNAWPRVFITGFEGSEAIGRADALFPLNGGFNYLTYGDLQAEVSSNNSWLASAGLGYRGIIDQHIYGGYLFLDRNVSENHKDYYILSPGVEALNLNALNSCWDFRINGYIPVNNHRKVLGTLFPGDNTCGINENCDLIEFRGHQEFAHRFLILEETGPGADAELSLNLPRSASLHAGAYYYHLEDFSDIHGVEGRIVLPFNNNAAITAEASYDNHEHGAIIGGLMFHFGQGNINANCAQIHNRLYDRIPRNLGAVRSAGVPFVVDKKDDGLFLHRDDIFFFTSQGGFAFDGTLNSGTFEHPLAANQFTQVTVDGIDALADNANLYFNPGTYNINNVAFGRIALPEGQSIFGRSIDYRCSAVGNERPLFLGGFDLFFGNNTLDSIRIENVISGTGLLPQTVVGLDIQNAQNVVLCNDKIDVTATVVGDNLNTNDAIAIRTNNSGVEIHRSELNAFATVTNFNGSIVISARNAALGIGDIATDSSNNNYAIDTTSINAIASVGAFNLSSNFAKGIGTILSNFDSNNFTLQDTSINASANTIVNAVRAINLANGIGTNGNTLNSFNFTNNTFNIQSSIIKALANTVENPNLGLAPSGNFTHNTAVGVGSAFGDFNLNEFTINASLIRADAVVQNNNGILGGQTQGFNDAVGIGVVFGDLNQNNVEFTNGTIVATGFVGNDNFLPNTAIALGSFGFIAPRTFTNNIFLISNANIRATARIGRDALGSSSAIGIGNSGVNNTISGNTFTVLNSNVDVNNDITRDSFLTSKEAIGFGSIGSEIINNIFNIRNNSIEVTSHIGGNSPSGVNKAIGIGGADNSVTNIAFNTNNVTFTNNQMITNAIIDGFLNNFGFNVAVGIGSFQNDFLNNTFNTSNNDVQVNAVIGSDNLGSSINSAIGIGCFQGNFTSNTFSILNSLYTVDAVVSGNNGDSTIPVNQQGSVNNAIGIGVFGSSTVVITPNANFALNNMTINNTIIDASAETQIDNFNISFNTALAIGNFSGIVTSNINNNFINNIFTMSDDLLNSTANVLRDNRDNSFNQAIGIGNIGGFVNSIGVSVNSFINNNTFVLDNSLIQVNANVSNDNINSFNQSVGIGNEGGFETAGGTGITNFNNNTVTLNNDRIISLASVGRNNSTGSNNRSVGIGFAPTNFVTDFDNNIFTINALSLNSTARVGNNNDGTNESFGLNVNLANTFNITNAFMNVLSEVVGNQTVVTAVNSATGLFAGAGSVINIADSLVKVRAAILGIFTGGTNTAVAKAGTGTFNDATTTYEVSTFP